MASKKLTQKKVQPAKKQVKETKVKPKAAKKDDVPEEVTLAELCGELNLDPRAARMRLRKSDFENPGRWAWPSGSKELSRVTQFLQEKNDTAPLTGAGNKNKGEKGKSQNVGKKPQARKRKEEEEEEEQFA